MKEVIFLRFFHIHPVTLLFFFIVFLIDKSRIYFILYLLIFLHELFHLFTALLLKEKCSGLYLFPWGCMLCVDFSQNKLFKILVLLSGPLFNLLLFLLGIFPKENLSLFLFNIFPVMPLDGGVIVSSLFPSAYPFIGFISIILLFAFSFFGKIFPFAPIVLLIVFIIGEKSRAGKRIELCVLSYFRQK